MSRSYISKLPKREQQQLLDDLNYLNLSEIKSFCKRHSIPYRIAIETPDGHRKPTNEDDRKGVILNRVRHFLQTGGVINETCFPSAVVSSAPLPARLTENDRLFYGQYDKANRAMIALLKSLTAGKFKNGAISRILAREFWTKGKAPTLKEYADAWLCASQAHTKPNPEWAFLSDRAAQGSIPNWKNLRTQKASRTLKILSQLTRAPATGRIG
jgi:hypothetical protein